jgi:CheY-like chemotaxis protein
MARIALGAAGRQTLSSQQNVCVKLSTATLSTCAKPNSVSQSKHVSFAPGENPEGCTMQANAQRCRVLVAEDEALISLMIEDLLTESGFVVVGPAASTNAALALVEREVINCAVLDVKLIDGPSIPVANALTARRIPFVVATGYTREAVPSAYRGAPFLHKAFMTRDLIDALTAVTLNCGYPHDGRLQPGTSRQGNCGRIQARQLSAPAASETPWRAPLQRGG